MLTSSPGAPYSILVCDDDADTLQILRISFARQFNGLVDLYTTSDAAAALTCFDAHPESVVLLDLMLPRRSGVDLALSILERKPDAMLLGITALDRDQVGAVVDSTLFRHVYMKTDNARDGYKSVLEDIALCLVCGKLQVVDRLMREIRGIH